MNYKDILKSYLIKIGMSFVSGVSGFWGLIVKILIKIAAKLLVMLGVDIYEGIKARKELADYKKKIANPKLSVEERRALDREFLGG